MATLPAKTNHLLPFLISAALGLAVLALALHFRIAIAYSLAADVFFIGYLALIFRRMPKLTADRLRRRGPSGDLPVMLIFLVTIVVVGVAIGSLFLIINGSHKHPASELLTALLSLPLGWMTIHTMAAMHYAHVYWRDDDGVPDARGKPVRHPVGGLDFPGGEPPQGWDFLYFAVVIGMTAQTADTGITTTRMRKLALAHSIVSFFFNAVILAAAVNLAVTLGG